MAEEVEEEEAEGPLSNSNKFKTRPTMALLLEVQVAITKCHRQVLHPTPKAEGRKFKLSTSKVRIRRYAHWRLHLRSFAHLHVTLIWWDAGLLPDLLMERKCGDSHLVQCVCVCVCVYVCMYVCVQCNESFLPERQLHPAD